METDFEPTLAGTAHSGGATFVEELELECIYCLTQLSGG
jgi:hypothetical protein